MAGAPNPADVHVDSALTDFSVAYMQQPSQAIARRVFPVVPVPKQSDKYLVWSAADVLRTDAARRAPGTPAAERNWNLSDSAYFCDVVALAHSISAQTKANDDLGDIEESIVRLLVQDLLIKEERDFSSVAFASSWGTNTSPGTVWSNAAAYPINDIATGIRTVLINTGKRPNVLALGADTWFKGLMIHEDLVDRLPDNSARIVTPEFVGNLLGFDEVPISTLVYNSAVEGLTASNAFAATGTSALILYRDANPGHMAATAGATFVWSGLLGAAQGVQVKRYDVPKDDAYPRVEVEAAYDHVIIASALGYYLYTCVS